MPIETKDKNEYLKRHNLFFQNNKLNSFCFCKQRKKIYHSIQNFIASEENKTLLITGEPETGKTQMINVILKNQNTNSLYINTSNLISTFYKYIKLEYPFQKFIDWLLTFNLLIFDSFHLIEHKTNINNAFINLINQLDYQKAIFIHTKKPNDSINLNQNLINQISITLKFPNIERDVLHEIVNNFLETNNKNIRLTINAIDFLIDLIGINVWEITNKLNNISVFHVNSLTQKIIGIKEIKKIFRDIKTNSIDDYQIREICEKLKFNINEILSNSRKKEIVYKRNIVIYLLKEKHHLTHEKIAQIFNKNHSTITHSLKQTEKRKKDKYFREYLENSL